MKALRLIIIIAVVGLLIALPLAIVKGDLDYQQQLALEQLEIAPFISTDLNGGLFEGNDKEISKESNNNNEWIIKWSSNYPALIEEQSTILDWLPEQGITRIKLNDDININEWITQWQDDPRVVYIQPNTACSISTLPNDTYYAEQYYLEQINAQAAWQEEYEREIIIAVLDTGIDHNHPDLVGRVLPGYNILNNQATAMDDNGHGTNVAGIIAAGTNNKIGISGIVSNVKLMPVKILDALGKSDSFYVGQGIRYAADHGANLIVIASGESVYTPFIAEAVDYAYEKGVLIIAAAGNKSLEINYPAALPNVIGVGAVDRKDRHLDYSNYGQQIDVVAPAESIYTTHLNNSYTTTSGTSVAAPQVAALAAVLMQQNPGLTLKETSDIIRFSADDVGELGWDEKTGYGRINFETALNFNPKLLRNGYKPNQRSYQAQPFPRGSIFDAQLTDYDEPDWFYLTLPYAGNLELEFILDRRLPTDLQIELYTNEQAAKLQVNEIDIDWELIDEEDVEEIEPAHSWTLRRSEKLNVELTKGKYFIKINYPQSENNPYSILGEPLQYRIINDYSIYHDKYEDNDRPWRAYVIKNISEVLTATFSKRNDDDWYRVSIDKNGTLSAEVRVNSNRVDPVLYLQRMGSNGELFDMNSSGKAEFGSIKVTAGEYLIRVYDYNNNVTNREYELELFFDAEDASKHGPNNTALQAKLLDRSTHVITSIISDVNDYDWFKFVADGRTYVEVELEAGADLTLTLYDNQFNLMDKQQLSRFAQIRLFDSGVNYIRLSCSDNNNVKYNLKLKIITLKGDFIDITDHYAQDLIMKYYELGLIRGYEDYTFKPDQAIKVGELMQFINNYKQQAKEDDADLRPIESGELGEAVTFEILSNVLSGLFSNVDRGSINDLINKVNRVPYASISRAEALIAFELTENMYLNALEAAASSEIIEEEGN